MESAKKIILPVVEFYLVIYHYFIGKICQENIDVQ